jgi:hypothetical protein
LPPGIRPLTAIRAACRLPSVRRPLNADGRLPSADRPSAAADGHPLSVDGHPCGTPSTVT